MMWALVFNSRHNKKIAVCSVGTLLCAAFICDLCLAWAQPNYLPGASLAKKSTESLFILETESLKVETVRTPSQYSLFLTTPRGQVSTFNMPDTPWNVAASAAAANGKAIVRLPSQDGGTLQGANTIFVLGSRPPTLLDQFLCEMPLLSPDGKFLAFLAYYPQHFAAEDLTSNFVMLYNLQTSPSDNRGKRRVDFPLNDDPEGRIGTQLYPLSRPLLGRNGQDGAVRTIHSIFDITWSPDSTRFIFLDEVEQPLIYGEDKSSRDGNQAGNLRLSSRIPKEKKDYLVLMSLQNGTARVGRAPVNICPTISGSQCSWDLQTVSFGPHDLTITQHFTGQANRDQRIQLPYEAFKKIR